MTANTQKIAHLNDLLRITFTGGQVVMTPGIAALPDHLRLQVFDAVRSFKDFNKENDPYQERDCATLEVEGVGSVTWKIDYYDPTEEFHSDDPSDPTITKRVLMIMLTHEY